MSDEPVVLGDSVSGRVKKPAPKAQHDLALVDELVEVLPWRPGDEVLAVLSRVLQRAIAIVRRESSGPRLWHCLPDINRRHHVGRVAQVVLRC